VHVAKELDVSAGTIKNWEMNRTTVAPRFLPRVVAFLGYDPGEVPSELPGTEALPEGLQEV
jgi:transcriptional regulator with XRE-family HTH domain